MPAKDEPFAESSPNASTRVEEIVSRFEAAWTRGERPTIEAFLPPAGPFRTAVLVELVHADLELRLKAGEAVRVETYLDRYPELSQKGDAVLDLLATEFT